MPRYIDADKLFTWLRDKWKDKYPVGDGGQFDTVSIYEIKQEIDDAETVDAIPIMWIYKYINENYEKYTISSFYGIRNEFELRAKAKELYIDLINDWRKENESNSNS